MPDPFVSHPPCNCPTTADCIGWRLAHDVVCRRSVPAASAEDPKPLLQKRARMRLELTSPAGTPFRAYALYGHEGESRADLIRRAFLAIEREFACTIEEDRPANHAAYAASERNAT